MTYCLRPLSLTHYLPLDAVLGLPDTADPRDILNAYVAASFKCHPDIDPFSMNRLQKMQIFQEIGDAYYTLSHDSRRRAYIASNREKGYSLGNSDSSLEERQPLYLCQFLIATDAKLKGKSTWTLVGAMSGAVSGFIVGGPVGAGVGAAMIAVAGSVRDIQGKSLLQVYQEFTWEEKLKFLKDLIMSQGDQLALAVA